MRRGQGRALFTRDLNNPFIGKYFKQLKRERYLKRKGKLKK